MYSKRTYSIAILGGLLLLAHYGIAQTTPQAPATIAGNATSQASVHGTVTDPSGALIPGTTVTVNDAGGKIVAKATADAAGKYEIHTLAPGAYSIMAVTDGFAPFSSQAITLTAGQVKRIDISMAIQTEQQNVVVTDETPTVSVDADSNANSLVIKGKDLEALSDDPDELSNELSALAGPSAGPNGGQIYIDGFSNGQLPPKSSIREIRVNQNPYSAEYDRLGFGRIEILTKPGTDKLHGQFLIQGNDSSFNTGNPFTKTTEPYDSYQYNGTLNGSLSKKASFFVSAEHRAINNLTVYDTPIGSGSISNPRSRTNVSPRIDLQLGQKNTLTMRYQLFRNSESGELGATQTPDGATSETSTDNNIQISDTQIINDHIVNETRFQYEHSISSTTPVSSTPTINVNNSFSTGGASGQSSHDHTDNLEFQNLTTMSLGKHAIKFGTRLRDSRDANSANSGFNGNFTFDTLADYQNAIAHPTTANPSQLTYATGVQGAVANLFDAALFVQDDWKFNRNLTLSGGLRWESQNHVSDHSDWAPRVSMAWALDGRHGKQAKTVLRAGYGIFYDRMLVPDFLTINRASIQEQFTLAPPTDGSDPTYLANCFQASQTTFNPTTCGTGTVAARSKYEVAPNYRSPYTQQFGASLERQVSKAQTATLTYLHSTGVHQLVEINANAPYFPDYNAALGNVYQFFPEGVFKQDQLILNTNARFSPNFNVFGFYTLSFANSNGAAGSTASNSLNLSQDYGRAGFVSRNSLFLVGSYSGPWGIRFNPFLVAQSGKPFNIVVANDLNGDTFRNDRPGLVASSNCTPDSMQYKQTSYGCLDTTPVAGEKLIAMNAGNGPAAVAVNLRVSRSFGIGPKLVKADPNANQGGQGGGPQGGRGNGGGGGGRGGPGGGFGPGGFGGGGRGGPGGMFGSTASNRRYNLNFSVQALNLFNNIDYGTPNGTAIAPGVLAKDNTTDIFGKSQSLAQGIFSQGSAARRVFLQAVFSF
ncbi:TonB-dependent receptor [Acidicapsa ligni]|uniref:TonB-dependent receptor n=1 Tax=Acidicapsa ligni TaxID=542300 RepID=UPI0021E0107E|nr:TonB-dependent receptor [Acidicapsa ligni]